MSKGVWGWGGEYGAPNWPPLQVYIKLAASEETASLAICLFHTHRQRQSG